MTRVSPFISAFPRSSSASSDSELLPITSPGGGGDAKATRGDDAPIVDILVALKDDARPCGVWCESGASHETAQCASHGSNFLV